MINIYIYSLSRVYEMLNIVTGKSSSVRDCSKVLLLANPWNKLNGTSGLEEAFQLLKRTQWYEWDPKESPECPGI